MHLLALVKNKIFYIYVLIVLIFPLNVFAANPIKVIKPPSQTIKYLPKLTNYGIKSITKADLALASKSENIATILEYQCNAQKLTSAQVYSYYKKFNSLDKGDELLLKCLQSEGCNVENYLKILNTSELHKKIILLDPGLDLSQVNQRVGKLSPKLGDVIKDESIARRTSGIRQPINAEYAGKMYPIEKLPKKLQKKYPNSVKFTDDGYPDFSPYAKSIQKISGLNGDYAHDAKLANEAAGFKKTPKGYVWHHHQDSQTMQLIPRDLHGNIRHSGGASLLKQK